METSGSPPSAMAQIPTSNDQSLANFLTKLKILSFEKNIEREGFESITELSELTDEEATELGGDVGMRRGEVMRFRLAIRNLREGLDEDQVLHSRNSENPEDSEFGFPCAWNSDMAERREVVLPLTSDDQPKQAEQKVGLRLCLVLIILNIMALIHTTMVKEGKKQVEPGEIDAPQIHAPERMRLLWVHTPKTGTSLCITLQHDQCWDRWPTNINVDDLKTHKGCVQIPGLECDIDTVGHYALPKRRAADDHRVVIILRQPKTRIISSFFDGQHSHGMENRDLERMKRLEAQAVNSECVSECPKPYNNTHKNRRGFLGYYKECECIETYDLTRKEKDEKIKKCESVIAKCANSKMLRVYADMTKGCVVKTLNGKDCYDISGKSPTLEMIQQAVARLDRFYFVGIFEAWDEMIDILNSKRRNSIKANSYDIDHAQLRIGKYRTQPPGKAFDPNAMLDFYDEADQQVYDAGVKIYNKTRNDWI